ncbi:MAG: hypothetical protein J5808_02995 [Paludibacteraceae bacterium]|nr:hypothetical protein [Paludibacteraceae bacterium]
MKKLILTVALSAIAWCTFAQSDWDFIGAKRGLNFKERVYVTYSTEKVCYNIPTYDEYVVPSNELNDENWTFYSTEKVLDGHKNVCMPTPVYEEYKLGYYCFKSGVITISVGGALALAGGICFLSANSTTDAQVTRQVGAALCGTGAAAVAVSLPLLCWGDFMKRDANWKLKIHSK